jgi:hypothetical protein
MITDLDVLMVTDEEFLNFLGDLGLDFCSGIHWSNNQIVVMTMLTMLTIMQNAKALYDAMADTTIIKPVTLADINM